jgi:hypothetical protein
MSKSQEKCALSAQQFINKAIPGKHSTIFIYKIISTSEMPTKSFQQNFQGCRISTPKLLLRQSNSNLPINDAAFLLME